jgi:predicted ATP-grasp superfamily ATP-dependent carboligase
MKVLITDGNERSALAVTRALGQKSVRVLVGSEKGRSLAAVSKYCWKTFSYPSPYEDPDGFIARVLEVTERHGVAAIFPMTDISMSLIGRHRQDFEKFAVIPMPSLEVYETLSDKYRLMQLARSLGVPIPQTVFVTDGNVHDVLSGIEQYPVVVKPARSLTWVNGRWCKTGVHYAASPEELRRLYQELDYLQQPSLIQRRIEGCGRGLFALMNLGKPLALFAHQRLRERPPSGGVSVLCESIPLPQSLTQYALPLLEHVGWHGVAMVEFKVDRWSGLPVLMEVNGRFWGSLQLALDAGVNFPFLLLQLATGREVGPISQHYKVGIKSRWLLGDIDHLLLRLFKHDADLYLPSGYPSKWETLRTFLRFSNSDTRLEVLQRSDPWPFVYELHQYLRIFFRRPLC